MPKPTAIDPDSECIAQLSQWLENGPRRWETTAQFERRIRVIASVMPHALAARWIDDALHLAQLEYNGRMSGTNEWSDLAYRAGLESDESYRKMVSGSGTFFDVKKLAQMNSRGGSLEEMAAGGNQAAVRDAAAVTEWFGWKPGDWSDIGNAYAALGEDAAAEAFFARALVADLFGMKNQAVTPERVVEESRVRL